MATTRGSKPARAALITLACVSVVCIAMALAAPHPGGDAGAPVDDGTSSEHGTVTVTDTIAADSSEGDHGNDAEVSGAEEGGSDDSEPTAQPKSPSADDLRASLGIAEDYRESFVHGDKPAEFQRWIVLHDTESEADAASVIGWWDESGAGVAAHFVVDRDGAVTQCVPLDKIAHHAGFGDTGHNDAFGVPEDGRDDRAGTVPIGEWASDYGMNAWSVGIEISHVGGEGDYPEAQLAALDDLIAYIDTYYGFESEICDHKAWRSGNSDTSPEFAGYLASYQQRRRHD